VLVFVQSLKEFLLADNLFLDTNGIIHNCTHPAGSDITHILTEKEMIVAIFEYIGHLFQIAKPRKLLFIAIDGLFSPEVASDGWVVRCGATCEDEPATRSSFSCCS